MNFFSFFHYTSKFFFLWGSGGEEQERAPCDPPLFPEDKDIQKVWVWPFPPPPSESTSSRPQLFLKRSCPLSSLPFWASLRCLALFSSFLPILTPNFEAAQIGVKQTTLAYIILQYDASVPGGHGGGGEYENQMGFGWTNGVILDLLNKYGDRLTLNDDFETSDEPVENSSCHPTSSFVYAAVPSLVILVLKCIFW